ncbi:hypothetical protein D3C83_00560 [compost metagenome]
MVLHVGDVDRDRDTHAGAGLALRRRGVRYRGSVHVVLGLEAERPRAAVTRNDGHIADRSIRHARSNIERQRRTHAHRTVSARARVAIIRRGLLAIRFLGIAARQSRLLVGDPGCALALVVGLGLALRAFLIRVRAIRRSNRFRLTRPIGARREAHRPIGLDVARRGRHRAVIHKPQRQRHTHRRRRPRAIALRRGHARTMMARRHLHLARHIQPRARADPRFGLVVRHRERQRTAHAGAVLRRATALSRGVHHVAARGTDRHVLAAGQRRAVLN